MLHEIEKRNDAILLLKEFIKLSHTLLPHYADLKSKPLLNSKEKSDLLRLENVYDNYNGSPNVSKLLLNSDIIEIIVNLYDNIKNNRSDAIDIGLDNLENEYIRLNKNWETLNLN